MVPMTVTVFQLDLLAILRDRGVLTVKELVSIAEGRSVEAVRIQLLRLFRAGLVTRSVVPGTRHAYRYSLAGAAAVFFPDRRTANTKGVAA